MRKYAIISYEFSNFTDRELITYDHETHNFHGNRTFRLVNVIIPLRSSARNFTNVFRDYYRPMGEIFRFEAEDDNSAKLIFEVGN